MSQQENAHLSDHLANERTFLAWIRTSIGIMAFGFVLVKFSLFVKQLTFALHSQSISTTPPTGKGYSSAAGIAMVIAGSLLTVFAFARYKRTERKITQQDYQQDSRLLTVITIFIFLVGLSLIAYLFRNI